MARRSSKVFSNGPTDETILFVGAHQTNKLFENRRFVPMNKRLLVWGHKKIAMQNYALTAGLRGQLGEHNAGLGLGGSNYRWRGRLWR